MVGTDHDAIAGGLLTWPVGDDLEPRLINPDIARSLQVKPIADMVRVPADSGHAAAYRLCLRIAMWGEVAEGRSVAANARNGSFAERRLADENGPPPTGGQRTSELCRPCRYADGSAAEDRQSRLLS